MKFFRTKVVNMTTLIGPKWTHKQEKHIFATYFAFPSGPDPAGTNLRQSSDPAGRAPCGFVCGFGVSEALLLAPQHTERPEASADFT